MGPAWDLLLSVAWRIVAIALIILEATRPAAEVSEARLVLYAAMLGLPTIIKARGGDGGESK